MQVSSNIIGFPVTLTRSAPPAIAAKTPAEVVPFPTATTDDQANAHTTLQAQDHGKIFAAHRIVARIADQLDQTATL